MEIINTTNAPAAIGPYSQGIKANNFVYTSGQLPIDPATGTIELNDIKTATTLSMQNLKAILEEAGTNLNNVVKTTIFLTNLADFAAVNEVYGSFFSTPPARSCIQVAALPCGAKVEIEAVATL